MTVQLNKKRGDRKKITRMFIHLHVDVGTIASKAGLKNINRHVTVSRRSVVRTVIGEMIALGSITFSI